MDIRSALIEIIENIFCCSTWKIKSQEQYRTRRTNRPLPPNAAHSTQAKHHQRQKEMNGNIQRTYTKQYQQKKRKKTQWGTFEISLFFTISRERNYDEKCALITIMNKQTKRRKQRSLPNSPKHSQKQDQITQKKKKKKKYLNIQYAISLLRREFTSSHCR